MQAGEEAQRARGQVEAIRGDNLALLERLKYVQGYQAQTRPRKSEHLLTVLIAPCTASQQLHLHLHLLQVYYCKCLLVLLFDAVE